MQAALPQETAARGAGSRRRLPPGPAVRVDAVEIDGRKIFVAGSAEPGRTVRGYANEILLGDAKVSPDGSYLIEAERDLPVGDYIIRVDALEPDGVKVAARAAVPFEREPGETIAAVAPQEPRGCNAACGRSAGCRSTGSRNSRSHGSGARSAGGCAGAYGCRASCSRSDNCQRRGARRSRDAKLTSRRRPAHRRSSAQAPAPEAPAAAAGRYISGRRSACSRGRGSCNRNAVWRSRQQAPGSDCRAPAGSRPRRQTPASPPVVAEAPAIRDAAGRRSTCPRMRLPAARAEPETDVAAAPAGDGALPAPPPAGVNEVLAPKLQSAGGAVIIRRGDTLWRISRRVYGRGVRYSTIYLANQSQIEDPDRIWPGQVFKVPKKSADGEADADYSTLGDRLTTVPEEGGTIAVFFYRPACPGGIHRLSTMNDE